MQKVKVDYAFDVEDRVLCWNVLEKTRKGSKNEILWLGPFIIVELTTTSCLPKKKRGKVLEVRMNLSQLKSYNVHADTDIPPRRVRPSPWLIMCLPPWTVITFPWLAVCLTPLTVRSYPPGSSCTSLLGLWDPLPDSLCLPPQADPLTNQYSHKMSL